MADIIKSAAAVAILSVVVAEYLSHRAAAPKPNPAPHVLQTNTRSAPAATLISGATAVLTPGPNGHYQAKVETRGVTIDMMVDTGASVVCLTADDAARLGIHPSPSDYTMRFATANGETRAAPVKLDMVRIDGVLVYDVEATVSQPGALNVSLLGMSFLKKLASYQAEQGRLVLHQ